MSAIERTGRKTIEEPGLIAPAGFDAMAGLSTPVLILESSHPGLVDRILLNAAANAAFLDSAGVGRWFAATPNEMSAAGLDVVPWTSAEWLEQSASASADHRIGAAAPAWWRLGFSVISSSAPRRILVTASPIDDLRKGGEATAEGVAESALLQEIEEMGGFGHYAFWPNERKGTWTHGMAKIWTVSMAHSQREFETMVAMVHPLDLETKAKGGERDTVLDDMQEVRIVRADGDVRYVRSLGRRYVASDGTIERVVRIDQDVTELRRTEEELRLAREAAGDAARAKEAFLHLMNHSLRTPLNAILGFGEAMADQIYGPLSSDYVQCIDAVNDSASRLLELVDDILDLTRLESGRYSLLKSVCDLNTIVAEIVVLMESRVTERNLRLAVGPIAPDASVWGEERGIRQILVNLLEFATNSGRETHTITLGADLDPGGTAVLWLEDDGRGLERSIETAIVDPLGADLNSGSTNGASSWFGLSLVKSFLQLHSGTLRSRETESGAFRIEVLLPR